MNEKEEIRKHYMKIRSGLSDVRKAEESRIITEKLLECEAYKAAKTVFVYVSTKNEVSTKRLIEHMFSDFKRVTVPLCNTVTHTMECVEINSSDELEIGAYLIPEPIDKTRAVDKSEIDLAVVPAVAFDSENNRLGMGGGYYDRFLNGFCGTSVGIIFEECVAEKLPVEEFDYKTDIVLSGER